MAKPNSAEQKRKHVAQADGVLSGADRQLGLAAVSLEDCLARLKRLRTEFGDEFTEQQREHFTIISAVIEETMPSIKHGRAILTAVYEGRLNKGTEEEPTPSIL